MTAESMHPARGGTPSPGLRLRSRLRAARLLPALLAACVLAAACHDDEGVALSSADDAPRVHASNVPLAQGVESAPTQTIAILASPARPIAQTGTNASPVAAPLAPPVIHTVD